MVYKYEKELFREPDEIGRIRAEIINKYTEEIDKAILENLENETLFRLLKSIESELKRRELAPYNI